MQYDTDVVTWSPQGRIFQIEYAMEAVKQGSAAVGLKVCLWLSRIEFRSKRVVAWCACFRHMLG